MMIASKFAISPVSAKHKAIRETPFDLRARESRAPCERLQLARDEGSQNGERAVLSYQAVMQKEPPRGRVEVVGDGVPVQVYDVDPAARDARHLSKQRHHRLVSKVV